MKKRMKAYYYLLIVLFSSISFSAFGKNENIAKLRVVTQSSSIDEDHCGHLAVDGSLNTYQ